NEKYDAAPTYKGSTGYQPAIAFIGKQAVFVEGRNGNTPAAYKMADTLKNCFEQLEKNSIHIQHFRSLALGKTAYQQEVVEEVQKHCRYFYIRIDESKKLQVSPHRLRRDRSGKTMRRDSILFEWIK